VPHPLDPIQLAETVIRLVAQRLGNAVATR
jgi:hypothetical protein